MYGRRNRAQSVVSVRNGRFYFDMRVPGLAAAFGPPLLSVETSPRNAGSWKLSSIVTGSGSRRSRPSRSCRTAPARLPTRSCAERATGCKDDGGRPRWRVSRVSAERLLVVIHHLAFQPFAGDPVRPSPLGSYELSAPSGRITPQRLASPCNALG